MNLQDYNNFTRTTAIYPGAGSLDGLVYTTLGLAGEAGELANKVKKVLRRDPSGDVSRETLMGELGDIAWYWMRLCAELGFDPEDVLQANVDKLLSRKERGTLTGSGDNR